MFLLSVYQHQEKKLPETQTMGRQEQYKGKEMITKYNEDKNQ